MTRQVAARDLCAQVAEEESAQQPALGLRVPRILWDLTGGQRDGVFEVKQVETRRTADKSLTNCYPLRLSESVTRVVRPWWQRTRLVYGAVRGRLGVGVIHHGYHGNTEVDPETVDHREAEEHQDGEVEASRAALRRDCSQETQRYDLV